jgi:hypothetical protein
MSGIKRLMEQQEEKRIEARTIALKAGVLEVCEFHSEIFVGQKDILGAYKLAAASFKRGFRKDLFENQQDLTDCIKEEVEDAAEECWACAKIRDE